ncbi:hypothetical protein [Deinococcus sp. Leaf326]|uniref:hypothetical protein n=1 Tax=Deinococcus sp. Leaf326 TaxID=1736338 RepID=UPI0007017A18|nr:hypothetical protein [Deinococcus sp. Leaf326]KQR37731.1 hypothetical protein ASF71_14720 [Deinococcus sp. Leaf326]
MADSTLRRSPQLERLRKQASRAVAQYSPEMFRHTLTFSRGEHTWEVRCSVQDPQKLRPDAVARLQATAAELDGVSYRDLRVLKVHPEDTMPFPGATSPWDDGTLEVLDWSQASDFTDLRTGTAVLRRP